MPTPRIPRTRATILVVDDDAAGAALLRDVLTTTGFAVAVAGSGAEAKAQLARQRPDLVILDIMLPDIDGLVFCADLRASGAPPIIMCSGSTRPRDATLARRLGADDYIAKPYDLGELEARIGAVLRRSTQSAAPLHALPEAESAVEWPPAHRLGNLRVDGRRRQVQLGAAAVVLSPTEYRLLSTLMTRPGVVFTREELAQAVWGYQDAAVGRSIDVHMRRLRMKLAAGPVAAPAIITVRGVGHKIAAADTASAATASHPDLRGATAA